MRIPLPISKRYWLAAIRQLDYLIEELRKLNFSLLTLIHSRKMDLRSIALLRVRCYAPAKLLRHSLLRIRGLNLSVTPELLRWIMGVGVAKKSLPSLSDHSGKRSNADLLLSDFLMAKVSWRWHPEVQNPSQIWRSQERPRSLSLMAM